MPSRERRILDKDKEIRKLKSAVGHYFTCTIDGAIKIHKLEQELECKKKQLNLALDCMNGVIKDLPWVKRTLDEITALEQKDIK